MADVDPEVIARTRLDPVAKERLQIQVDLDALEAKYKDDQKRLKDVYTEQREPLLQRASELDPQIWHELDTNRSALIEHGKQSFITLVAKFQLRHRKMPAKILDEDGVLKIAKHLRIMRKVADPPRTWTLNRDKFIRWPDQHGDYRHLFEEHFQEETTQETLTMYANDTFVVTHSKERVSPPPTTIKKS